MAGESQKCLLGYDNPRLALVQPWGLQEQETRSRKNYQYTTEGQKFHQNFALAILWYFLGKLLLVLVFAGTAPRCINTSSGKKLSPRDSFETLRLLPPKTTCSYPCPFQVTFRDLGPCARQSRSQVSMTQLRTTKMQNLASEWRALKEQLEASSELGGTKPREGSVFQPLKNEKA